MDEPSLAPQFIITRPAVLLWIALCFINLVVNIPLTHIRLSFIIIAVNERCRLVLDIQEAVL